MPRDRQRACLQDGLKLDLNRLARQGFVRPGCKTGPMGIRWSHGYWGEIAAGVITANMSGSYEGWLRINIVGGNDQWIILVPRRRHLGGHQWYFVCPSMKRHVSVLWMPPGAKNFACRQYWGSRRVAYATQFLDRTNRAHHGQSRIKNRLIADLDPDEWSLPPKPKWMRWRTYNRHVDKFDRYEAILNEGILELLAKFMGRA
jgi:hypothetical protein